MDEIEWPLALFSVAVVAALVGVEGRRPFLFAVAKPIATLSLLGVTGTGGQPVVVLVVAGLLLSAAGDIALVFDRTGAFMAGLGLFLVAHLCYAGAFLLPGAAGPVWAPLVGLAVFGMASGWLVKRLWAGAGPAMRLPLLIYALAITGMVAAAFATLSGPWPSSASSAAAMGALLFYFSDANLAWNRYVARYHHGQSVTLSLYWSGQLGIALAARWAGG